MLIDRLSERGVAWTTLAAARRAVQATEQRAGKRITRTAHGLVAPIEAALAHIERRRHLVGPGTLSSLYQSYELNKATWDSWDWSYGGEEWTQDAWTERGLDPQTWRKTIVELIEAYVAPGSEVLEVGPGAGRWTAALVKRAGRVTVADISEACLDICRERFGDELRCFLVNDQPALDLPAHALDAVWSYDVFVHINPAGVDAWLAEISRLLKPGGHALIHHGGGGEIGLSPHKIGRSNLDARYFRFLAEKNGLEIIEQDTTLAHKPGDVISICRAQA